MGVTIFTHCKAFRDHIGIIQRNAIGSWLQLGPECEVVLCGDREGTAQTAKEFGLRHLAEVGQNEYGTPLVNDLFDRIQRIASHDVLCYANCDIIFLKDFVEAVEKVRSRLKRFLTVGECWNLDLTEPLAFEQPDWQTSLRRMIHHRGTPRGPRSIDYFIFSRGLYRSLPPFVFGTAYFDNWLIWRACALWAAAVDATKAITAVHQNHDYAHVHGGYLWTRQGEAAKRNLELAGGLRHIYFTYDTTHRLDSSGLRRNYGGLFRLKYRWEYEIMDWRIVQLTRPIRHLLGLRKASLERLSGLGSR